MEVAVRKLWAGKEIAWVLFVMGSKAGFVLFSRLSIFAEGNNERFLQ